MLARPRNCQAWRMSQKRKFSGKKCTSSGRVYKSVLKEVHFFQEDLFEFWFLEQPSVVLLRISFPGRPIFIQLPPGWGVDVDEEALKLHPALNDAKSGIWSAAKRNWCKTWHGYFHELNKTLLMTRWYEVSLRKPSLWDTLHMQLSGFGIAFSAKPPQTTLWKRKLL